MFVIETVAHAMVDLDKQNATQAACWVCGSTSVTPWKPRSIPGPLTPEDLRITDARYGITLGLLRCASCGFIFADGQDLRELVSLYERLEDDAYAGSQEARLFQMQWLLRRARKVHPAAQTLLDIGAGAGLLVSEARRQGLAAEGVEPSRYLVATAQKLNQVTLHQGIFPHPDLAGKTFDLVFLMDVIEHVADPVALLRHAAAALSPGGLMVVVTPDIGSLAARLLGRRWWHLRLAHVGYFNRVNHAQAAARAGLRPVKVFCPKWFFPVGYVAERLAKYLPIGPLNRLLARTAPGRWLFNRVVPVNPHDSLVMLLQKETA